MSARRGEWIQTFSGGRFWPLDPRPEDVYIGDIAHALSMKCRYAGHTTFFYSVAEHSVHVCRHAPAEHKLWALLHDAAEAYTADIPRPVKRFIPEWRQIEANVMRAICDHFGLPHEEPACVKVLDTRILEDEMAQIMAAPPEPWKDIGPPLGVHIGCWTPDFASQRFLQEFLRLTRGAGA